MARLKEIYGSLFSGQSLGLTPSEVASVLLEKNLERDASLLQLSICRRLFAELQTPLAKHSISNSLCNFSRQEQLLFNTDVCRELSTTSQFVPTLICQLLNSGDQLVSFCTSKILSVIFSSSQMKAEWLDLLLQRINTQSVFTHVAVYSLQVFSEVLKLLRKKSDGNTTSMTLSSIDQQKEMCFVTLQSWWMKVLQVFVDAMAKVEQQDQASVQLELSLGEFLSLVVEILRHKFYDISEFPAMESKAQGPELQEDNSTPQAHISETSPSSSASDTKICPSQYNQLLISCQRNAIHCVPRLALLMQSCSSVFIFRRLLDILLKVTELSPLLFEVITHVRPHLTDILQCRLLNEILHSWIQLTGHKSILLKSGRSWQKLSCIPNELEAALINTAVRKLVLLLLKYAASVMEEHGGTLYLLEELVQQMQPLIHSITSSLAALSSDEDAIPLIRNVLFQVMYEQDDCVVEALLASCRIHHCLTFHRSEKATPIPQILQNCLKVCDVHALFVEFLASISFDHSVILDFLISAETKFQKFFQRYLQILQKDWSGLQFACSEHHNTSVELASEASCSDELDSEESSVSSGSSSLTTNGLVNEGRLDSQKDPKKRLDGHKDPEGTDFDGKDKETEGRSEDASTEVVALTSRKRTGSQHEHQPVKKLKETWNVEVEEEIGSACSSCSADSVAICASAVVTDLSFHETTLDQVMGCLIRLRFALERLHDSGLFPVSGSIAMEEVLSLLERVEQHYEQEDC